MIIRNTMLESMVPIPIILTNLSVSNSLKGLKNVSNAEKRRTIILASLSLIFLMNNFNCMVSPTAFLLTSSKLQSTLRYGLSSGDSCNARCIFTLPGRNPVRKVFAKSIGSAVAFRCSSITSMDANGYFPCTNAAQPAMIGAANEVPFIVV